MDLALLDSRLIIALVSTGLGEASFGPSQGTEEPARYNTRVKLLTGGLLVRVQPEEPIWSPQNARAS